MVASAFIIWLPSYDGTMAYMHGSALNVITVILALDYEDAASVAEALAHLT